MEDNRQTVAVLINRFTSDRYGEMVLRFAELDTDTGRISLLTSLDNHVLSDLQFEVSYARTGSDAFKFYGVRLTTRVDECDIQVATLERVLKTVKNIRAGLHKIETEWGKTRDFAMLATRVCKVLKIKKVFVPTSNQRLDRLVHWSNAPDEAGSAIEYKVSDLSTVVEYLLIAAKQSDEY